MARFNSSLFAPILRVIQFLSAIVSLILWAVYLSNLNTNGRSGLHAVLGILVAATLWVVCAVGQYVWKRRDEKGTGRRIGGVILLAILVALIDFAFLALFATVAGITSPASSRARGGGVCYGGANNDDDNDNNDNGQQTPTSNPRACGQVNGVFALSIVSIFSHGSSSIMNLIQSLQQPPNPKSLAQNPLQDVN